MCRDGLTFPEAPEVTGVAGKIKRRHAISSRRCETYKRGRARSAMCISLHLATCLKRQPQQITPDATRAEHMLRHSGRTCAPSCHWRYSQRSPRHTDESYEREFGSVRMKYLEHLLKTFGNQPAVWTAGSASGILCAYLPTAFWK